MNRAIASVSRKHLWIFIWITVQPEKVSPKRFACWQHLTWFKYNNIWKAFLGHCVVWYLYIWKFFGARQELVDYLNTKPFFQWDLFFAFVAFMSAWCLFYWDVLHYYTILTHWCSTCVCACFCPTARHPLLSFWLPSTLSGAALGSVRFVLPKC